MMNQKVVVLNADKMDYDGKLDFSALSPDVTVYADSAQEEILDRIQGACVIVTKELPVSAGMIRQFPDSVKLICEAGTGYNNIALDSAAERGIQVCNDPAGTALIRHFAQDYSRQPPMVVERRGYGIGKKDFGRLSAVRAGIGEAV